MKIEHIKVGKFNVAEVVKEIHKRTEGRNVHGIYFNSESLMSGTLEIYTTDIRTHVVEVEKPVKKETKKSKYRGVCWDKGLRKWRVRIMVGGKRISLGLYDDEVEAAKIYDAQAKKSHGSRAKLNFNYEDAMFYSEEGFSHGQITYVKNEEVVK